MKPIINPLWFYLINVADNLIDVLWTLGGTIIVISGAIMVMYFLGVFESDFKEYLKRAKKFFILGILMTILGGFIPTKTTCYQMMTASMITPNNLEIAGETATNVVDYIVDSVDKLIEDNEEKESN